MDKVTINGFTQDSFYSGQVKETWDGYNSMRVFVENPSDAVTELLNKFSCWGGADKIVDGVKGWEIPDDRWSVLEKTLKIIL